MSRSSSSSSNSSGHGSHDDADARRPRGPAAATRLPSLGGPASRGLAYRREPSPSWLSPSSEEDSPTRACSRTWKGKRTTKESRQTLNSHDFEEKEITKRCVRPVDQEKEKLSTQKSNTRNTSFLRADTSEECLLTCELREKINSVFEDADPDNNKKKDKSSRKKASRVKESKADNDNVSESPTFDAEHGSDLECVDGRGRLRLSRARHTQRKTAEAEAQRKSLGDIKSRQVGGRERGDSERFFESKDRSNSGKRGQNRGRDDTGARRNSRGGSDETRRFQHDLATRTIDPLKLATKNKPIKPIKSMTMAEWERHRQERQHVSAIARFSRQTASVDCHLHPRAMDKSYRSHLSAKRRLVQSNIIARDNLRFIESLQRPRTAYSRERQLQDFKRAVSLVGRRPRAGEGAGGGVGHPPRGANALRHAPPANPRPATNHRASLQFPDPASTYVGGSGSRSSGRYRVGQH